MFKKTVAFIISFAVLVSVMAPAVFFAEDAVSVSVATLSEPVDCGDRIELYVRVSAEPNWSAVDMKLGFDPQVLELEAFTLNGELQRQASEGGMTIFAVNDSKLAEGEYGIGFATVSSVGGYEGYYPAEYDYFGILTFKVLEEAEYGFTPVTVTVRRLSAISEDNAIDVPFTATDGGVIVVCEHSWKEIERTEPGCEEDGYIKYVCPLCRSEKSEPIPAIGHKWGEGVQVEPTCEEAGGIRYVCENDPTHIKTEEQTEPIGHSYVEVDRVEPTCTEAGRVDYVCENDKSHTYTEILPAKGHTKTEIEIISEPTCSSVGELTFYCTECKTVVTEEIPIDPNAHEWDNVWELTKEPTCSVEGIETCHCLHNSEHTMDRSVESLGHIWDEGTVTLAPTCTHEGLITYVCQRNELHTMTEGIAIDPQAHLFEESIVPPGCVEEGYTAHICKYNPEHWYATDPVPAVGHVWKGWRIENLPTCESAGSIRRGCENCDDFETIELEALGHDFGEWETVKAPTPLYEGEERRVCKNDPSHIETRSIPKLDYIMGDLDFDASISVADALALLRIAAGIEEPTELQISIGDVDLDGSVTVADALSILRIAAGLSNEAE